MQIEQVRSFVQEVVTVAEKHELPAEVTATLKAWLDGHEFTAAELLAAADSIYLHDLPCYNSQAAALACQHTVHGLNMLVRDNSMESAEYSFDAAEKAMTDIEDPAANFNAPWGRDHY